MEPKLDVELKTFEALFWQTVTGDFYWTFPATTICRLSPSITEEFSQMIACSRSELIIKLDSAAGRRAIKVLLPWSESESRGRGKDEDRLRRTPDRKCGDREVSVLKGWQYT